ncbi:hypothetical protein E3J74_04375 [Candidatus Bathyarchaeota archaeon]|nr:MAG: hypothetical protein E3J74_04375 [Candidatus Bathyarchaeota archaeon]
MVEPSEQEILAKIRTLLALERNYMAEERTALAEFRTGLALTVIAPAASTIVAYIFSVLPIEKIILLDLLNLTFFSILTIIGIWTSLRSRSKLKTIRKKKKIIKNREATIIKSSKPVYDLLCDCIDLKDETKK